VLSWLGFSNILTAVPYNRNMDKIPGDNIVLSFFPEKRAENQTTPHYSPSAFICRLRPAVFC